MYGSERRTRDIAESRRPCTSDSCWRARSPDSHPDRRSDDGRASLLRRRDCTKPYAVLWREGPPANPRVDAQRAVAATSISSSDDRPWLQTPPLLIIFRVAAERAAASKFFKTPSPPLSQDASDDEFHGAKSRTTENRTHSPFRL
jgi:hypothetical protein